MAVEQVGKGEGERNGPTKVVPHVVSPGNKVCHHTIILKPYELS